MTVVDVRRARVVADAERSARVRGERGGFLAPEVIAETGVSFRSLDYYTRMGYLRTAGDAAPGSGRLRVWPPSEVDRLRLALRMISEGWSPAGAFARLTVRGCPATGRGWPRG